MSVPVTTDEAVQVSGRWLQALSDAWPRMVCRLLEAGEPAVVRILIAEVKGSAPREPGTCMLVCSNETYGTIGGGNLEWQALGAAHSLLSGGTPPVQLRRLVLGRELGQCCGGVVQLWLERFTAGELPLLRRWAHGALLTQISAQGVLRKLLPSGPTQPQFRFSCSNQDGAILVERIRTTGPVLWLYGAGHVAQALVRVLAGLPFDVTWIDSRAELLPASLPANIRPLCCSTPAHLVSSAPPGTRFLVMTHDHALDYALCRRILQLEDCAWLGLIGSKSKGARFRSRLARDGVPTERIERLVCPIGIGGIDSKLPAAIAVAVAAQLLCGLEPTAQSLPGLAAPAAKARGRVPAAELLAAPDPTAREEACTAPDCAACALAARSSPNTPGQPGRS